MKRSEMVALVTNVVAMYRHIPQEVNNLAMATIILNLLENKGMQPPQQYDSETNEWEEEGPNENETT